MTTDQHRYRTELERVFQFTQDDLRLNRQGKLSPTQQTRLRRVAMQRATPILLILGALGILTLLSVPATTQEVPLFLLCLGIPAIVTFTMTIAMTESAVSPGLVTKRSGQLHLRYGIHNFDPPLSEQQTWKYNRNIANWLHNVGNYSAFINDVQFQISREQFFALVPQVCHVYFVPTIRQIVAIEFVDVGTLPPALVAQPAEPVPAVTDKTQQDFGDSDLRG
jgi:hypothetical protein